MTRPRSIPLLLVAGAAVAVLVVLAYAVRERTTAAERQQRLTRAGTPEMARVLQALHGEARTHPMDSTSTARVRRTCVPGWTGLASSAESTWELLVRCRPRSLNDSRAAL